MKERKTLALPAVIRVDTVNSIYEFDLTGMDPRGDIHDFYELVYVRCGTFSVLVDGVACEIPEGSLFVYAPNAYHIGNSEGQLDAVVNIVSFSSESRAMHWFDNRLLPLTEEERALVHSFFQSARELLCMSGAYGISVREGGTPRQLQLIGNRLEHLLLSLCREDEPPSRVGLRENDKKVRFLALSAYLKRTLAGPHTLADMAEAMACSVSSVKALCRRFCASGPNEYLISLRIGRARELIREGRLNFTEIAETVGFGSLHYFSRVFKARTGETPSEYARSVL